MFYYAAGAMGYGNGWFWHRLLGYAFPKFVAKTKTITLNPRTGTPFLICRFGSTVWNRMGLPNIGFVKYIDGVRRGLYPANVILSVHGNDDEIQYMVNQVDSMPFYGIELNYSCPNVASPHNVRIPTSNHMLFLKLDHTQDPFGFDMDKVYALSVNSVPMFHGGISGELAQKYNWQFIEKYAKHFRVCGSSWQSYEDIKHLEELGCTDFDIGSIMLIRPSFISSLEKGGL